MIVSIIAWEEESAGFVWGMIILENIYPADTLCTITKLV